MSQIDRRIIALAGGEDAQKIEAIVKPFLQREIERVLATMEAKYNDPEASMDMFYGLVAEFVALRRLVKEISAKKRLAQQAQQQELAHGPA